MYKVLLLCAVVVGASCEVSFTESTFRAGVGIKFTADSYTAPPHISKVTLSNSFVDEEIDDVVVGSLSAVDAFGEQYNGATTFTITDQDHALFEIDGTVLKIADGFALDFETASSHDITVQAEDASDALIFAETTFTINVQDVDESPVGAPSPSPSPSPDL